MIKAGGFENYPGTPMLYGLVEVFAVSGDFYFDSVETTGSTAFRVLHPRVQLRDAQVRRERPGYAFMFPTRLSVSHICNRFIGRRWCS